MHDYQAVSALVACLTRGPTSTAGIVEVRIRASPVFSPESLHQAYEMLVEDTPLRGSRLVVEETDDRRDCVGCGGVWTVSRDDVAGHFVVCPTCGTTSPLVAGRVGIELLGITTSQTAP